MAGAAVGTAKLGDAARAPRRSRAISTLTSGASAHAWAGHSRRTSESRYGHAPSDSSGLPVAAAMPKIRPPSICCLTISGLTTRPQSTAHTARSTRSRARRAPPRPRPGSRCASRRRCGAAIPIALPGWPPSQPPSAAAVARQRARRGLSPSSLHPEGRAARHCRGAGELVDEAFGEEGGVAVRARAPRAGARCRSRRDDDRPRRPGSHKAARRRPPRRGRGGPAAPRAEPVADRGDARRAPRSGPASPGSGRRAPSRAVICAAAGGRKVSRAHLLGRATRSSWTGRFSCAAR